MKKLLKAVLGTLLCALLLAAFYIAVIMGDPQEEESAGIRARQDQPLLSPMSSPLLVRDQSQLQLLLDAFPAPVMAAMHSAALIFDQGLCQDVPFEGGLGRMVTLTYRTPEGAAVTVASIYPARALSLIEKGNYTISGTSGLTLAGLRSVRMDSACGVRMHAQGADALYVVTLPPAAPAAMRAITSTLQLYQGE